MIVAYSTMAAELPASPLRLGVPTVAEWLQKKHVEIFERECISLNEALIANDSFHQFEGILHTSIASMSKQHCRRCMRFTITKKLATVSA